MKKLILAMFMSIIAVSLMACSPASIGASSSSSSAGSSDAGDSGDSGGGGGGGGITLVSQVKGTAR